MTEASENPRSEKVEAPPPPSPPSHSLHRALWVRIRALFTTDRITAAFTVILALATLALVVTAYVQHTDSVRVIDDARGVAERQHDDTVKALAKTDAAVAETRKLAKAAEEQAAIAKSTLEVSQRPWLFTKGNIGLIQHDISQYIFTLDVDNTGDSLALNKGQICISQQHVPWLYLS